MTSRMTPATFFARAKTGNQIKLGDDSEPWKVLAIVKGSHAHIARDSDTQATFAYLSGVLLRFENLQGPSFDAVEIVE